MGGNGKSERYLRKNIWGMMMREWKERKEYMILKFSTWGWVVVNSEGLCMFEKILIRVYRRDITKVINNSYRIKKNPKLFISVKLIETWIMLLYLAMDIF